jgi:AraC-like DNA-binding protein
MNVQPSLSPVSLVILFGILQGILIISSFLRSSASGRGNRNYIFIFFVLVLVNTESFLNISGYMVYTLHLVNFSTALIFLIGPLLYAQVLKDMGKKKLNRFAWHFLPAILFFAYSFFYFLQPLAFKYDSLVRSFHPGARLVPFHSPFLSDPLNIRGIVVVELLSLHLMIYGVIGMLRLRRMRDITFLRLMHIFVMVGALCMLLSEGFVINGVRFLPNPLPRYTPVIFAAAFLYGITFYLLGTSFLSQTKREKYSKSKIPPELQQRNAVLIEKIMKENKSFLDKNFSLGKLAELTGISSNHLSQTINEVLRSNFFELTNQYRIEEAKSILQRDSLIKIEEIGYQVGYKSKSAFYNAFKKQTGVSPASFRQHSGE